MSPNRKFGFTWHNRQWTFPPLHVLITLEDVGGSTVLILRQTGFHRYASPRARHTRRGLVALPRTSGGSCRRNASRRMERVMDKWGKLVEQRLQEAVC